MTPPIPPTSRTTAAHVPVGAERSSGSQGSDPLRLLRRWFEDRLIDTRT